MPDSKPFAIVTGASTGIGLELARLCAKEGFDLLISADEPAIHDVATELRAHGVEVESVQVDLATTDGVDTMLARGAGRPVDYLLANAGRGLGHGFVDQEWSEIRRVIDTNVTGTTYLLHKVARRMKQRASGRILIVGSVAGFIPGTFQAVYNGTKGYLNLLSWALRNELGDTGVTVTDLMPGPTETDFFERAHMEDTKVGTQKKADPADVAKTGFDAMMRGDGDVVAGWRNKLQTTMANVTPSSMLAQQHRALAEPGSGDSDE